ncbi:MAG: recombinase family protein, partial [Actinomycetota bacterium]|nr:recombinase family protein [Actinomycetota bacterium]
SPAVQRAKIEQWAALHDEEIDEWEVEEDVSGVKSLADRKLGRLVERCERRESHGIVVYRVDRFSRSPRDTFEAIDRLEKVGARLVGVADGVDSTAPSGELVITVLAGIAREQWKQRRENWAEATGRAVADGVHISSRPPTGYVREDGRRSRLIPDPAVAPLVRECFIRRAGGESWQKIADYMTEQGTPISKIGVRRIARNRAYLGEARGPHGAVKKGAHEALVTVEEWEAAQWAGRAHAKDGTIASQGMLSGLITCASCGHLLSVGGSRSNAPRVRGATYFCKTHFSSGKCEAPGAAKLHIVDTYVGAALSEALVDGTLQTTMDAVARYRRAVDAVADAERRLDELADPALLAALGSRRLTEAATAQRDLLTEAKRTLRETPTPGEAIEPTTDLWDPEAWPIERQRQLARQFISEVTLTRGGKGRGSAPIAERITITWAGHDQPDTTIAERLARSPARLLDPQIAALRKASA